jgi:hypothetical protein
MQAAHPAFVIFAAFVRIPFREIVGKLFSQKLATIAKNMVRFNADDPYFADA